MAFLGRWVDGCCQPSLLSLYLGPCKETAPAVHAQLKTIKLLFIHGNTHKTASLRLAGLFTTLIRESKDFCQPGRPKGRWVSLWSFLEQIPCVTKLRPLHHLCRHQGPDWLTATSADLQPASPASLAYFPNTFPHIDSALCSVRHLQSLSTILSLPVILPPFLIIFLTSSLTAFSYNNFLIHLTPSYGAGLCLSKTLDPCKTHS